MHTMIVSEKPIAGRSIAEILSQHSFKTSVDRQNPSIKFSHKEFGEVTLIPLKGHIAEVDFPDKYSNWYSTDVQNLVETAPVVYKEKEKGIINTLKKEAKETDVAIVATDADREGESIGAEAVRYIKAVNPKIKIKRAYFSAITVEELSKSFSSLQELNFDLADAADARREIDLIWGAALTRFLSLATKSTGKSFLSVGRVQSPTLAAIVKRELEIDGFKSIPYWEIEILCDKDKAEFTATHKKGRFEKEEDAKKTFSRIKETGVIVSVKKTKREIARPVPFNTTDFLRVSAGIGFDAIKAMEIAEKLYMEGYISYPRTDNQKYIGVDIFHILNKLNQGEFAQSVQKIKALPKIVPSLGKETKDHPPIHPVAYLNPEKVSKYEYKIYKLIVDRFLATLAENAQVFVTVVELESNKELFVAKGTIIEKKGWFEFYPYNNIKEAYLPDLKEGDVVLIKDKKLLAKQTKPPARYSQGTLIKLMEELNLGTKSTRPAIIEKLYARQYISGKKQIQPSELAKSVIISLDAHAKTVVEPEMTATLEKEMNDIEEKKNNKETVVKDSRDMLTKIIKELKKNKDGISAVINKGKYQAEDFGKCPVCGSTLRKLKSRRGKWFVSCSAFPKCRTSFPLPQYGETIFQDQYCDVCKSPKIMWNQGNSSFTMCINPDCESNKEWKERQQKAKQEAEKKKVNARSVVVQNKNIADVKSQKTKSTKTRRPQKTKK